MPTTYFSPTVIIPTIKPNHVLEGSYILIQDEIKTYSVLGQSSPSSNRNGNQKKAIIVTHDMMGFNNVSNQICDIIASQGYRVMMPYLFLDEPYTRERAVLESNVERFAWIARVAPVDHLTRVIDKTILQLRTEGFEDMGVLGLSWGGKVAALASQNKAFSAAITIHTPWLTFNDLKDTECPICLITPGDLQDLTPVVKSLQEIKPFARKIVHARFQDLRYGLLSMFTDFANPMVAELATDVLRVAVTFLKENLGIRNY
ncbi:9880_t:CDS:2 [Ambispora gerdemannii]|uniref:9880_t:CDS:1 n=1 Tax=Ambispora gerdemannii TaxID=144530 RepID=A0A9N8WF40_9GLOM|nr:9880_t:CDS:2 [Ambispora gerdemannii]